jgi:hypothetical protein
MINLENLIFKKEKLLTDEECDFLVDTYNSHKSKTYLEQCANAFTGLEQTSSFLAQTLVEDSEACDLVHSKVKQMVNYFHDYIDDFKMFHVNRRLSLLYPHKYRLLKYEEGSQIHPHTDYGEGIYGSCTINLNDDYEGGDFGFWGNKKKFKLKKGEALIFPADFYWVHEVNKIEKGVRYSTNCFLQNYRGEYNEKYNYYGEIKNYENTSRRSNY